MLLPAKCTHCSHEYEIDSGYLGIKRKCPACGEKFVFEIEDADDGRTLSSEDFGLAPRVACHHCFRVGVIREVYVGKPSFPCSFCGGTLTVEEGEQFMDTLRECELTANSLLLAGAPHSDVAPAVMAAGMPDVRTPDFVDLMLMRLPFTRYEVTQTDLEHSFEPRCATNCDLCAAPLRGGDALKAYYVHWHKVERGGAHDENVLFAGMAFGVAGAVIASSMSGGGAAVQGTAKSERHAVYCLCQRCRDSLTAWLFNKYDGPPVSQGFKLHKVRELDQNFH